MEIQRAAHAIRDIRTARGGAVVQIDFTGVGDHAAAQGGGVLEKDIGTRIVRNACAAGTGPGAEAEEGGLVAWLNGIRDLGNSRGRRVGKIDDALVFNRGGVRGGGLGKIYHAPGSHRAIVRNLRLRGRGGVGEVKIIVVVDADRPAVGIVRKGHVGVVVDQARAAGTGGEGKIARAALEGHGATGQSVSHRG